MYEEVICSRVVYEVTEEDRTRHFVYLLDETLEPENVGLISTNMEELPIKGWNGAFLPGLYGKVQ